MGDVMRRGEVRWYTFKAPDKRCPVLILTRNLAIGFLNALTVAPITTTIRDIPSEVFLTPEDGLFTDCAANLLKNTPTYWWERFYYWGTGI